MCVCAYVCVCVCVCVCACVCACIEILGTFLEKFVTNLHGNYFTQVREAAK